MKINTVSALLAGLFLLIQGEPLLATDVQSNYWYHSTISSDAGGSLDLLAELNYDTSQVNAPIVVVMHGYSGSVGKMAGVRNNAKRLRDDGFFAISVAMRGRDGSDGVRDSGGLEIYDIYDAVEAVKADPQFAELIDISNVHIVGYSGGGGNTMSALTKFPDYFRVGAAYFGMSDYGYHLTNGWYNKGADSRRSQLNTDIGNPNTGGNVVLDRYLARASNRASKNNPYSEIHLFVNWNETICPVINDTSYLDNAIAAESSANEFDNITLHIGGLGTYEDFNNNSINDANELQSWVHGNVGENPQDSSELWFRDRLLAGTIPQPVLNASDELYVAGYIKTERFKFWLGDGQNAAATLTYSLSNDLMTFSPALISSDGTVTGSLTVDTAVMAGRVVSVELNNVEVATFSGGGNYTYIDLGDGDTLKLIDVGVATNSAPTLTSFASVVNTTTENTKLEITFAELAAQGDEADIDGNVEAFVVQALSTGTLKLGANATSATAFVPGSNATINVATNAYWTPARGKTGNALNAFTVVARDDNLTVSAPPVQVIIEVSGSEGTFTTYHDMGGAASTGNITTHYTDASNAFTSLPVQITKELINYSNGDPTGIEVTISGIDFHDHRTPSYVSSPAIGTPADALFNVVGLDLAQGSLDRNASNGTLTISLTGLAPGRLYDVAFFGDRSLTADGLETFTLGGADSATNSSSTGVVSTMVTTQETRSNGGAGGPGEVIRWTNIDPGDDGEITMVMNLNSGTNRGYLNAMRLEAQVQTLTPPIAYYDFENNTLDASGHGNDGTNNGVTFSTNVAAALTHSTKSGNFDGSDYVNLGYLGLFEQAHAGGLTISMWVKAAAGQTFWTVAEGNNSIGNPAYVLGGGVSGGSKIQNFVRSNTTAVNSTDLTNGTAYDNTWHHIVYSDDGGDISLYIDGALDANSANFDYTKGSAVFTFQNTSIGAWLRAGVLSNLFTGLLDDVAFYDYALTQSEINALASGVSPLANSGNSYSDWIGGFNVGGLTALDDDADGDGVKNAIENFFGTAPDVFSKGVVVGLSTGNGSIETFTFTHPQGALADDLSVTYRWSKDLNSFNPSGFTDAEENTVDFTVQLNTPVAGTTTVTAHVSGSPIDRIFVDIEVTQN